MWGRNEAKKNNGNPKHRIVSLNTMRNMELQGFEIEKSSSLLSQWLASEVNRIQHRPFLYNKDSTIHPFIHLAISYCV